MFDDRSDMRNSQTQTPKFETPKSQLPKSQSELVESATETIFSAQLEFMQAMNQCALTWWSLPAVMAEACAGNAQRIDKTPDPTTTVKPAATMTPAASAVAWPMAPMVSGIEDTLGDQFFVPRPPENARERDIMTLWKQSNEFEPVPYPTNVGDNQHAA